MDDSGAYVISQSVCAMIEAMGMRAENERRLVASECQCYGEEDFNAVIEKYGIYHNSVVNKLNQGR